MIGMLKGGHQQKDKSVLSHKTLEQVQAHPEKNEKNKRGQKAKVI